MGYIVLHIVEEGAGIQVKIRLVNLSSSKIISLWNVHPSLFLSPCPIRLIEYISHKESLAKPS